MVRILGYPHWCRSVGRRSKNCVELCLPSTTKADGSSHSRRGFKGPRWHLDSNHHIRTTPALLLSICTEACPLTSITPNQRSYSSACHLWDRRASFKNSYSNLAWLVCGLLPRIRSSNNKINSSIRCRGKKSNLVLSGQLRRVLILVILAMFSGSQAPTKKLTSQNLLLNSNRINPHRRKNFIKT